MEPVDGVDGPPCKRCRRESKPCTLPPAKRKRNTVDDTTVLVKTTAKRQHLPCPTETSDEAPVVQPPRPRGLPPSRSVTYPKTSGPKFFKISSTAPSIRDLEGDDNDAYIMSTAAPWAIDFLPVTFCGTIADLSNAAVESETTSTPSFSDAEESGLESDSDPPNTVDTISPAEIQLKPQAVPSPTTYANDMGLDDVFDYVVFG